MRLNPLLSEVARTPIEQRPDHYVLKQQIYDTLSEKQLSRKELDDCLKEINIAGQPSSKQSLSERDRKQIYSEAIRDSMAQMAAGELSTNTFGLEKYDGLKTLLDTSGTPEAEEKNRRLSDTLLHGSLREKSGLFQQLTSDLLKKSPLVLHGKTEERLILEWKELKNTFLQYSKLTKMAVEAKQLGVVISPEKEAAFRLIEKKSELPYRLMSDRAEMIANPYYSEIHADDLLKIKPDTLRSVNTDDPALRDYLENACDITEHYKEHILNQVKNRLEGMGYSSIKQVRFGNVHGQNYETKEVMGALTKGKPVYIFSDEGKLKGILQVKDHEGFLMPSTEEYKQIQMHKVDEYAMDLESGTKEREIQSSKLEEPKKEPPKTDLPQI